MVENIQKIKTEGKIEAVQKEATEGKKFGIKGFTRGVKIGGNWYNMQNEDKEQLDHADGIVKGNKISFETNVGSNVFRNYEIESYAEEEDETWQKADIIDFHTLMDIAHTQGLMKIETRPILIQFGDEAKDKDGNNITQTKKAVFQATVVTKKGTFMGTGDATPDNVHKNIAKHFVRMAETRAISRALRWATNNASEVSNVELTEADKLNKPK